MNWKSLFSPRWFVGQNARKTLRQYSILLGVCGLLMLLSSLGGAFMLTYWFLMPEYFSKAWMIFFLSSGFILMLIFLWLRYRGNQHFKQLVQEMQAADPYLKPEFAGMTNTYLFYGQIRFLQISLLLYGLSFVLSYFAGIALNPSRLPSSSPQGQAQVQANKQRQQLARDTTDLGRLEWVIAHQQEKMQRQQNQLKEAEQSLRQQWGALAQARQLLAGISQPLQAASDSSQRGSIAQQIRNNPALFAQVKGMLEVQYALKNEKETVNSEALLQDDAQLLRTAQDLRAKYQRDLNRAQKGINYDQKRIKELKQDIQDLQHLCDTLKQQLQTETKRLDQKKDSQEQFRKEWKVK